MPHPRVDLAVVLSLGVVMVSSIRICTMYVAIAYLTKTRGHALVRRWCGSCTWRDEGNEGAASLAIVTIHDYLMVMKCVRVAELKAHLSEHLRSVRRGHPIAVMDRDTPIAQILPLRAEPGNLPVRQAKPGAGKPKDFRLPEPLAVSGDVVTLLLADRRER
jgi:antitoxin (DNA-binding transcriptional repressor) of toxin-antitoxin stability system